MPNVVTKIYSLGKEVFFIMKKRKFSKVIAVALAALMVVGMVPMMAFADELFAKSNDITDATYYASSYTYEEGDESAYINFEYVGVDAETAEIEFDYGDDIAIVMDDGDGYTNDKNATDSLGWYSDVHTLVLGTGSADRNNETNNGRNCLSANSGTKELWSAVATDEEGKEYTFTISGGVYSSSENSIVDKTGESSKMTTTISYDGTLDPGSYDLTINYAFQIKHNHGSSPDAFIAINNWTGQMTPTGSDTITINVTAPETPDDEKELEGGITKTVTGSKVAFSGGSTGISEFNPALDLSIYDMESLTFTYDEAVVSVNDTVKASFNYTEIPESIMEYEDLEFGITDITSSYSPETTITADMVIPLIAGLADDEEIIGIIEGLGLSLDEIIENVEEALPITIDSSNGISGKMAVEFTAVATADDGTEYELEVVETDDGYSISASGLPAGTYSVEVGYTLTFGFDYDFSTSIQVGSISLGPISIPVSASVITKGSEDNSRTITDSDTFTITVNPCTHPEESVSHTEYAEQTCADGNNEYWYCALCGRYFLDEDLTQEADYETEIVIPGDGSHVWSDEEGTSTDYVAPNCTEDGAYATKTCAICGEKYRFDEEGNQVGGNEAATDENVIIPVLGHTEVVDEAVEPTCGATGLTEGSHCEVCGEIIIAQEVVPATGEHSYVAEVTKEAEVGVEGETTYTCEVCGDTYTEPIPALEPETETEELPSGVTKSVENTDVTYTIDGDYVIDIVANVFGFDISLSDIPTTQNGSIVLSYTGLGDIASGATLTFVPEFDTSAFALTAVVELDALGSWASMVESFYSDWPYIVDEGSIDGYSVEANWISATATNVETGAVTPIDIVVGEDGVATFSVAGLEDGEYEITVDYDLSIITDLNLLGLIQASVETMSIPNCSDTFTITVSGEAVVPAPGEDEPCEHEFYIVDSQAATCTEEGWVLYACSICGEQFTQYTAALGHDFVNGVCTRCGALEEEPAAAGSASSSKASTSTSNEGEDEDEEFEEVEDEDEFTEVEEDEFEVVEDEETTSPATGASMAAIATAMAFAAAGVVVVTRKKKEDEE